MILMDRICFPDVPLEVVFLRFHIEFWVQSFQRVKLLLLHNAHSKRLLLGQEPFSSPGADYPPQIIFKTAAPILAVGQRLLSYNTCRRFLILRSDNFSIGYCTCRHPLSWRKVEVGNASTCRRFSNGSYGRIFILATEEKWSAAWH